MTTSKNLTELNRIDIITDDLYKKMFDLKTQLDIHTNIPDLNAVMNTVLGIFSEAGREVGVILIKHLAEKFKVEVNIPTNRNEIVDTTSTVVNENKDIKKEEKKNDV